MFRYIVKRILINVLLLLIASMLIFALVNISDTDVTYSILGNNYTEEAAAALRARLGLDQPKIVQYFQYMGNLLKGDLGVSYATGKTVVSEIARRILPTVTISLAGLALAVVVGISLGMLSAVKQYTWIDYVISAVTMCLQAMPAFFLALLLMLLFCVQLKWLPTFGISSWKGYILPVICGSLPYVSSFIRNTRSAMLDTIRQDYVRTARSKGANERSIMFVHALRNAMLPIASMIGGIMAGLMGGSMVVENVFQIQGMGLLIQNAINNKDIPLIMGTILFMAAFYTFSMILVDIVFTLIDPRVKSTLIKSNGPLLRKKRQEVFEK